MRRQAGFSLLEMAIVLAILGLIVGAGLLLGSDRLGQSRLADAEARLDRVEGALRHFASANRALPCPDVTGDGVADGGPTCAGGQANGVVPWVTVGMRRDEAIDPWGHYLSYRVDDGGGREVTAPGGLDMTACSAIATAFAVETVTCANTVHPNDWLLNRGLIVQDPSGASTVTINDPSIRFTGAAYVLISHGESGVGGVTGGFAYHAGTLSTAEAPNAANLAVAATSDRPNGHGGYVSRRFGTASPRFDDLIRHPDLMSFAVAAGLGPRDLIAARLGSDRPGLAGDGTVAGTDTTPAPSGPAPVSISFASQSIPGNWAGNVNGVTNQMTIGGVTISSTSTMASNWVAELLSQLLFGGSMGDLFYGGGSLGVGVGNTLDEGETLSLAAAENYTGYTLTLTGLGPSEALTVTGWDGATNRGVNTFHGNAANQNLTVAGSFASGFDKLVLAVGNGDSIGLTGFGFTP